MPRVLHVASEGVLRLLLVAGFGLVLVACSKCDVPTWQHSDAGTPLLACHSDKPAQQ